MNAVLEKPASVGQYIDDLLRGAIEAEASDVHLVAGSPPAYRRNGRLRSVGQMPIDKEFLEQVIRSIAPTSAAARLAESQDADFALQRDVSGQPRRFRVNVFHTRGMPGCSIRVILDSIPTFSWAGFPGAVAERIAQFRDGLVLFTGVTGSGKSTSMAMIIDMINLRGGLRIITLEDPVEYLFQARADSIITQREIGADVPSFADGLKYGLRQDPDVILVGEIRDRETAQLAITAAETGHLVISTMHTRDAKGAITRMTDMAAKESQDDLRTQLALSLRCIISQHLLPSVQAGERRVLALEVLFNNLAVGSAIRSGRVETIGDAILGGKADGMIALDQWLAQLLESGAINEDVARRYANHPRRFGNQGAGSNPH